MCVVTVAVQESLIHAEVMEDTLLCGGQFLDHEGSRLAVTAYDCSNIRTFTFFTK